MRQFECRINFFSFKHLWSGVILKALAVKVSLYNASISYRGGGEGGHISPPRNYTILTKNKMLFRDFSLIKRAFIIWQETGSKNEVACWNSQISQEGRRKNGKRREGRRQEGKEMKEGREGREGEKEKGHNGAVYRERRRKCVRRNKSTWFAARKAKIFWALARNIPFDVSYDYSSNETLVISSQNKRDYCLK